MACTSFNNNCPDKFGCPPNRCPDFIIKRHDTRPEFKVEIEDCDGPIDLTDLVCEVSMWAKGRLKRPLLSTDTYFALADDVGFGQCTMGDIIVMDRVRSPEQMMVTGFDELNKLIQVQRGYNGSLVSDYPRGTNMRIFRTLNSVGTTEMIREDLLQTDGTTDEDVLTKSNLIYEWQANDTCLPGCYWLEFKLLKMTSVSYSMADAMYLAGGLSTPSISFISYTPSQTDCSLGIGVEWVRRYPAADIEGYLIKIVDSPTAEGITQ
jgi:hypothetical protein